MLNDITIVECEVMSHLVRLRGKDTVQCAHCAMVITINGEFDAYGYDDAYSTIFVNINFMRIL